MSRPIARSGGFAEFVTAPSRNIFVVPQNINLHHAALCEPTAVAFHAVKIAEQASFNNINKAKILIIGGGAIGLLVALVLKTKNAEKITMVDTNIKRLSVCKTTSSYAVAHPDDDRIKDDNYDIVF